MKDEVVYVRNIVGLGQLREVTCAISTQATKDKKRKFGDLSKNDLIRVGVFLQQSYLMQNDLIKLLKDRISELEKGNSGVTEAVPQS